MSWHVVCCIRNRDVHSLSSSHLFVDPNVCSDHSRAGHQFPVNVGRDVSEDALAARSQPWFILHSSALKPPELDNEHGFQNPKIRDYSGGAPGS